MENEEENKAGTQAAAENAGKDNNQTQENTQENNTNNDSKDVDIAKAFGNQEETKKEQTAKTDTSNTENKNEKKGGSKANSVAKQNEDGSITFKNQEELNGFINKMYAKGASNVENKEQGVQDDGKDNPEQEEEKQNKAEQTDNIQQVKDYTDSIALALVEADINPKRARMASRLIDQNKVVVNGVIDESKMQEEINNLVANWPELKATNSTNNQNAGFKFGAEEQKQENNEDDQLAEIFGNRKND